MKPLVRKKAKANCASGGGDQKSSAVKSGLQKSDNPIKPIHTDEELAKLAGVSRSTIRQAEKIIEKGTPEQQERARTRRAGQHSERRKKSMKQKNDLAISVTGNQPFMGKEIPVVLGGFGPKARCICDKTAGVIHGMKTRHVRELVNRNPDRFKDGMDYLDMKKGVVLNDTYALLDNLGYTRQEITQAEHIYILSERGYAKLVKIMDTDQAWDVYEHLLDEYFLLREEKREQANVQSAPKLPPLSSVNGAMKLTIDAMRSSGMAPEFIVLTVAKAYEPYGIVIPKDCLPEGEKLYECEAIAAELGVMSESGKPHKQAVSAIIGLIGVHEDEVKVVPFATGHYANDTKKYKRSVMERVGVWLEENGYPTSIRGLDGKNYKVKYKRSAA